LIALVTLNRAAEQLGRTPPAVRMAAQRGELPRMYFGRAVRVATEPLPQEQAALRGLLTKPTYTVVDLAQAWDIHPDTLQRLARARAIPMTQRQGRWTISRTRLAQWLAANLWPL
jgi:hypothetical protein